MVIVTQFRRVIPLSISVIGPLVLVLIGYIAISRPSTLTALASPANAPATVGQAALELSAGYDQIAHPGESISFTHILTNTGVETDSLTIEMTSPLAWPIELGIGHQPIGSPPGAITLSTDMSTTFYVSMTVPTDTAFISGTVTPIIITATSLLSPTAAVFTTDTLTVYTLTSSGSYTLYLPSLVKDGGARFAELGIDFGPSVLLSDTTDLTVDVALARDLGTTWTRAWLPWAQIETAPGQYDWSWADTQFNRFTQAGYKIDAVIYFPPVWAAGTDCGPISDTVALTQFVTTVIARYGDQVDAWEFINEPDSFVGYPSYGPAIGCWAAQPQLYADRLALFHDLVKALDPTALVVFGGLAYDNWQVFDRDFLTHTLQSGAGPYFDVLSLHFYPINAQDFPTIAHKITEIKTIMQRFGVYYKLIWITETAMWTNGPGGLEAQQNFIVQEHTRGFCAGAAKIFWFNVREDIQPPPDGPMMPLERWLIDREHQLERGYATYQNYAHQIEGAFCRGTYTQVPPNVEAYELGGSTSEVYILWASSGTAQVTVPAGSSAALIDRDGQTSLPLTASDGIVSFTVGAQPSFVVVKH